MNTKTLPWLDRLGSVGAVLAAAAAPCCFPLLAAVGGALGAGALAPLKGYMAYVMQSLVLVALAGNALAWRQHRRATPLAIAIASVLLVFTGNHTRLPTALVYAGLAGLLVTAIWNAVLRRRSASCCGSERPPVQQRSVLTCPQCGHRREETMPTDACVYFWDCPRCRSRLKPKPGDCCVFCSYGSVKCPPIQTGATCCSPST